MNLVIRAITLNDRPLTQAIDGCFDARGGTIGRSESNTMALPDPERHISRLQAEVIVEAGRFLIRNAGSANPILVNGHSLGPGDRTALSHNDELRIGGYMLGVSLSSGGDGRTVASPRGIDARQVIAASAAERRTDAKARAAGSASGAGPTTLSGLSAANPFADLMSAPEGAASSGAVDPFAFLSSGNGIDADPLAAPIAPRAPASPAAAAPTPASTPTPWPIDGPASPPPSARLPDDFDPFADITASAPPPPAHAPVASAATENDLLGSVGAGSGQAATIDALFGLDAKPQQGSADPLAGFMQGVPPASSSAAESADAPGAIATDPLALFGAPPPAAAPRSNRPAAFNHAPELAGAYTPPRILDAAPAPAPPAAAPLSAPISAPVAARAAPRAGPHPDELWSAFCEGAGVKAPLAQALDAAQMRMLGQVLREAVEGTLRLMTVRATAKQELRAAVTTIRSRNNNPLKFSPDAQVAMEQLLQPPLRGFMPAPAAMQDAMHDLVGHSIGTMAGMRAALAGVLERFQPQQLEAKLSEKSVLDSLLAMNRKAKLWDLYLQHFDAIRGEAQDDFHTLFGKAFVAAYEEQLDRLPQRSDSA